MIMPLDPQAKALLDAIEKSGTPPIDAHSPAQARILYDQASELVKGELTEVHAINKILIQGHESEIPALLYRPSAESGLPLLVYFHGGGYVIGSLASHDCVCRTICEDAQCLVISVDYRLAPEHKYPAAINDAWAATQWVAANAKFVGGDENRIAIGGDSAGGNLAAVVCLRAKAANAPRLLFQLLIYPGTEMNCTFPSHKEFGKGYRLTNDLIDWFYTHYFSPQDDLSHWKASPLNANDLSDLPPALVLSAGFDPLQDENTAYVEKLTKAGVVVKHSHYETMMHGFITMPGALDKAKIAISECARELVQAFNSN